KDIISPILDEYIPILKKSYCAALIGWGSDVLGNDDELSMDHEWGPRCIIFVPEKLIKEKNYIYNILNTRIPNEYKGYCTRFKTEEFIRIPEKHGNVHIEISTCKDYVEKNLGFYLPSDDIDWLYIPENKLLEFTRGEIFYDGYNELTQLREFYKYYPEDVWKFRLAFAWQSLGWDIDLIGLCNQRKDILSARHCLSTSLYRLIKIGFLLNKKYSPSYKKWLHREFYKLPNIASEIGTLIEECYVIRDLGEANEIIKKICYDLLEFQNSLKIVPQMHIKENKFSRGFFDIDFTSIATQIQVSIKGELRHLELDGAVDQWITNDDILIDISRFKKICNYYKG
ncbi:MAG: DUF4037 domain-containing protein, partial [Proteobacteria bacterium]|nr:DUF4037 domain-containing protein [Pseudomonadota bacterium]